MPAAGTSIDLCGALRVELGGQRREGAVRGRQGRLLLAFLVLTRERAVRRDELVEALWADTGRPPSDRALAPLLSRLRAVLPPGALEGRDELRLRLPEPVWVDVEVARAALDTARSAQAAGQLETAIAKAGEAAALIRGGLLPGLDAGWLDAERSAVDDLRVEALELAAAAGVRVGGGALPAAEEAARAAVTAAPFRESARLALLEALAARGNTAEALRAYEEVRVLLREELGAVPGPALLALHERLMADAPAPPPARLRAAPSPPVLPVPGDLVERDAELARLDGALAGAVAGQGGLVLLEGPAGVGKTRLLDELRARAAPAGAQVRAARASVLEREFGFGVVRQLFEDLVDDPEAFAGAAAPARAVLTTVDIAPDAVNRSFAALHGLHRLVVTLAGRGPLVLAVDDVQWADSGSLRFLAYVARRLEGLPVLVAATLRTGEPATDPELLGELLDGPGALALRPDPLSPPATRRLVEKRMGPATQAPFADACHEVTGGNPLLLRQLLSALESQQVPPDAEHAAEVRGAGRRALGRSVVLRLARLGGAAVPVARAVALLGEDPGLRVVAALAGTSEDEAAAAAGALARAEILRGEAPLGFVHPLVRDAVYDELPAAQRGLEHGRAARLLDAHGAGTERVAAQLLQAPPAADPWVVERLREAAREDLARGAPESAVAHLQRACAEPPPHALRGTVELELGEAAATVRGDLAVQILSRALPSLTDPAERGEAALRLSRLQLFLDDPSQAPRLAAQAIAELPEGHDDLRLALETIELVAVNFGVGDRARLARLQEVRRGPRQQGPGARGLTALAALWLALECGPAEEAAALAREAFADDVLLDFDPVLIIPAVGVTLALLDPGEAMAVWQHVADAAWRGGTAIAPIAPMLWGGWTLVLVGDLVQAGAWLARGLELQRLWGMVLHREQGYSAAFQALVQVERGDIDEAWRRLALTDVDDGESDGSRFWLVSRCEALLAEERWEEVLTVCDLLAATRPPDTHPVWAPWRGLRARALHGLGEREEARVLASDELALARRTGAPWVVGRGLRLLGSLEGADGAPRLREAGALLAPSSARLEHAKAEAALGDALAAAGRRDEAAAAWHAARPLAHRCGADGLEARLAAALAAARPDAASGS